MTPLDPTYEYSQGYILMRLPKLNGLPETISLDSRRYVAKPGLHCSLVAVKKLVAQLIETDHMNTAAAEKRALDAATDAINHVKPTFTGYLNEVKLADQPNRDRHTVIIMADVERLEDVFREINEKLGLDQPVQPAHVTLFTADNKLPIGATTPGELSDFTRPLSASVRAELSAQIDPYKVFKWSQFMAPAPVRNNLTLELHVPSFGPAREFYSKFGFTEIDYDPISGGGDSDLGYFELKREDALGRTQLNFYGDKDSVSAHAHFNDFPANTPRGYAVDITIPVTNVVKLWNEVGSRLPQTSVSERLMVKRWGIRDFRVIDPYGFYVRFTDPVDWNQDK
jgi:hypothetical protein